MPRSGAALDPSAGAVPFAKYAADWLEQRQLSPKTAQLYELLLRLHLVPTFGDMSIGDTRQEHVRAAACRRTQGRPCGSTRRSGQSQSPRRTGCFARSSAPRSPTSGSGPHPSSPNQPGSPYSLPTQTAINDPGADTTTGSPVGARQRTLARAVARGGGMALLTCGGGSHLVLDTTVRALRHLMVSAVKTIWAKARPKRCPRPGRRSDQAPPINDRASAGPTTRS